jgi:hypothetical protein
LALDFGLRTGVSGLGTGIRFTSRNHQQALPIVETVDRSLTAVFPGIEIVLGRV